MDRIVPIEEQDRTVQQWILTYRSESTRRGYSMAMRMLLRYAPEQGESSPSEGIRESASGAAGFTREQVIHASARFEADREPGECHWNKTIAAWRSFYDKCIEWNLRDTNPAVGIRPRKLPDKPQPSPTEAEVRAMWDVLNDEENWSQSDAAQKLMIIRDRALFAILIACGLRNDECCSLKRSDFDPYKRRFIAKRKGGKRRTLIWPKAADPYIEAILQCKRVDDYLFTTPRGTKFNDDRLNKAISNVCVAAGTNVFTAHSFRRFAVSDISEREGIDRAKLFAGHESLTTTMIYDQNRFLRQVTGELYDGKNEKPRKDKATIKRGTGSTGSRNQRRPADSVSGPASDRMRSRKRDEPGGEGRRRRSR